MTKHADERRSERLELRISPDTVAQLDELRRIEHDLPSRSDLVRRLIERASARLRGAKR